METPGAWPAAGGLKEVGVFAVERLAGALVDVRWPVARLALGAERPEVQP